MMTNRTTVFNSSFRCEPCPTNNQAIRGQNWFDPAVNELVAGNKGEQVAADYELTETELGVLAGCVRKIRNGECERYGANRDGSLWARFGSDAEILQFPKTVE